MKRCSRGTRRNKKTGNCEPVSEKSRRKNAVPLVSDNIQHVKEGPPLSKMKRCPNGSRRNKISGECVTTTRTQKTKTLLDYFAAKTVGKGKKASYMKIR